MICPVCPKKGESRGEYRERLRLYLQSLPAQSRTSAGEYEKRLLVCGKCDDLINGTCMVCGCYVEMRAAKSVYDCPCYYW